MTEEQTKALRWARTDLTHAAAKVQAEATRLQRLADMLRERTRHPDAGESEQPPPLCERTAIICGCLAEAREALRRMDEVCVDHTGLTAYIDGCAAIDRALRMIEGKDRG